MIMKSYKVWMVIVNEQVNFKKIISRILWNIFLKKCTRRVGKGNKKCQGTLSDGKKWSQLNELFAKGEKFQSAWLDPKPRKCYSYTITVW